MKKIIGALVFALLGLSFSLPASAELVLVENGESRAPIVVFADAPAFTRQAAEELADYLEKSGGARPEILEGRPEPLPEAAIWVGYQPVLEELFPGIDFNFAHPEEILIAAGENHLVIAGRDRWDPENTDGKQWESGTHNAVYTFLQDYLGVRWFWPGPFGEDVPEKSTIAFEPFEYRYHPQIRGRARLFRRSATLTSRGNTIEWSRHQRLLFDSIEGDATHAFTGWWDRFHETNPEFFALQPDGTRTPYSSPRTIKMCVSNPDLWEQWLKDVDEMIEENPGRNLFSASPNDGGSSGYCVCENCLAWDHPEGRRTTIMWQGLAQEYVSLSDRYVKFANTLARLLRERHPGRELYVGIYAYGSYYFAPVEQVPDDNVIIGIVASFHGNPAYHPRLGVNQRDEFLEWGKFASNIMWRPNLGRFARWSYLTVEPGNAIEDMRLAAGNNVMMVDFDMWYESWATQAPHYYMLGQMTWNPYADGQAILDDYYRRAFGPAADDVRAYWELVEETIQPFLFETPERLASGTLTAAETYDEEFFRRAHEHLDRAKEVLEGAPEIYRERVGFVRVGVDYWEAMFEALGYMERFRASDGRDREAEEKALEVWVEKIRPLVFSEKYPTALNPSYTQPSGGTGRLGPYHPEALDRSHPRWRR